MTVVATRDQGSSCEERLGLLAVVLLVVANVFLIPLAFKNAQGPAEDAEARSSSSVDAEKPTADPRRTPAPRTKPLSSPTTPRRC